MQRELDRGIRPGNVWRGEVRTGMSALLAAAWPFLAGIVAIVAAWLVGRQGGKKAAGAQVVKRRLEAIERAQGVDDAMADLDADELRRRARKWLRDGER